MGVRKLLQRKINLIFIFYGISSAFGVDYCQIEREKCTSLPHIGCNETRVTFEVNPNCSNITVISLQNSVKNYILEIHNELREKLAAGQVGNYPAASRMLEMFWDEELEATACQHVQYCMFEHDKCRATPSFKYPGQNIRISHYTNYPQTNIKKELHDGILDWFNEYGDVAADIVDKYENRPGHKQYGHFTAMAKDNNDRIGCCYITYENFYQFTDIIEYSHLFTCNYRETNLINRPVYLKGDATSRCGDFGYGYVPNDKQYPHLCTNNLINDELTLQNEAKSLDDDVETGYCEIARTKCGRNKHVGCIDNSGFELNENCMNMRVHNMSEQHRSLLLTEHNKNRNLIASGTFNNFPAASKMVQLEWDAQLEDVACQYVKYCQASQPAECLATVDHDLPGQSVYHTYSDKKSKNHAAVLQEAVRNWFNQSSTAPPSIVDFYENVGAGYYGSFALMIRDAQHKIGCCFATFEENVNDYLWQSHLVSCVYQHVNFLHTTVYEKGKPASDCKKIGENYVTSDVYPNLCANNVTTTTTVENRFDGNDEQNFIVQKSDKEDEENIIEESENELFEPERDEFLVLNRHYQQEDFQNDNISHYCQLEIEKCEGRRHIGCETDPGLKTNPECIDIEVVEINEKMKRFVVNMHNSLRSAIAGGKVKGYPSASKMREVEWDSELADVACEHVQKCQMQQDECRATFSYDNPAQNFYATYADKQQPNHTMVLQQGIRHWFHEHKQTEASDIIPSYRTPANSYRFLVMVKENNDKIGCCYIQNKFQMPDKTWYSHMFTCNYRENNERGRRVYTMGKPATECHQWGEQYKRSKVWNNLCVAT